MSKWRSSDFGFADSLYQQSGGGKGYEYLF